MLEKLYPAIGTTVKYVRQNASGSAETGSGVILGMALDVNRRLTVHIELPLVREDGSKERVNIDRLGLNPSLEFVSLYAATIKEIKAVSDEGNGKAKEVVADYNKRVDDLYAKILGEPIVIGVDMAKEGEDKTVETVVTLPEAPDAPEAEKDAETTVTKAATGLQEDN